MTDLTRNYQNGKKGIHGEDRAMIIKEIEKLEISHYRKVLLYGQIKTLIYFATVDIYAALDNIVEVALDHCDLSNGTFMSPDDSNTIKDRLADSLLPTLLPCLIRTTDNSKKFFQVT